MLRTLATIVVICSLSAGARAESFDDLVSAKHLASCTTLVAPSGELRRPCKLAAADLTGGDAGITLSVARLNRRPFPKSMLEYTEADIEAKKAGKLVATYHLLEIATADGGGPIGQAWSKLIPDKDVAALAKAAKLTTPTVRDTTTPPLKGLPDQEVTDRESNMMQARQHLTGRDDMKELLATAAADDAVVIGSAPGQRYTGKAGAKSIRGWKGKMHQEGGLDLSGTSMVMMVVAPVIASSPVKVPYVMFAVYIARLGGGGSPVTSPALYQFSVPQP